MDTAHIENILALHFHPEHGTPFWLERQQQMGLNVREEIHSHHDFHRLGVMDIGALRSRPITDFIPRALHQDLSSYLLSETGGTTGDPCRRVFSALEFHNAFLLPWQKAVAEHNFPQGGRWLFVGPGGPHIIDRSARYMARAVGSLEPFTVDCDVRWIKRQAPGSMGLKLYMDHVLAQAANIIGHQEIDTLFTTPPLLVQLARIMSPAQKEQIRGIHTGGMALNQTTAEELQEQFRQAVILPGYGNSLFGVIFPTAKDGLVSRAPRMVQERPTARDGLVSWAPRMVQERPTAGDGQVRELKARLRVSLETETAEERPQLRQQEDEDVFQVLDPALWLQLAPLPADAQTSQDLSTSVEPGKRGRVILHRLDPSFLIINLPERDTALAIACPKNELGLASIAPLKFATPSDRQGVY